MHRLDEERTLLLYLVSREMLCYEAKHAIRSLEERQGLVLPERTRGLRFRYAVPLRST
jgi:hypothetical protein